MLYRTRFHQNPSNDSRDIVILRFFDMVTTRQLGFVEHIIAPHTKYSWWSLFAYSPPKLGVGEFDPLNGKQHQNQSRRLTSRCRLKGIYK